MLEAIKEILGKDFDLSIGTHGYREFLESRRNERLFDSAKVKLFDLKLDKTSHVHMHEVFECCGKIYMYNFSAYSYHNEKLLKICMEIAKYMGYTYLGFTHLSSHFVMDKARELGFKELLGFNNLRSGNDLSEMYTLFTPGEIETSWKTN